MKTLTVLLLSACALMGQASRRSAQPAVPTAEPIYAPYRSALGLPFYGFYVSVLVTDTHTDSANLCITYREADGGEPKTVCAISMRYIETNRPGYVSYSFYTSFQKPIGIAVRSTLMTLNGETKEVRFDQ
jgi:hypothetical protein